MSLFKLTPCNVGIWAGVGLLVAFMLLKHTVARFHIRGKVALVTGGSVGIGLDLAKELAKKGAHVYIAARRTDILKTAQAEVAAAGAAAGFSTNTFGYVQMDVADEASVAKAVKQIFATHGRIDLLICNAGLSHPSRFLDIPESKCRQMMDVNFFGCVNVVRAVLPKMLENKSGRVVVTSSMASAAAVAGFSIYSPTKAAVRAFAQAMDMENAALGVRFQVLNPPDVQTPGFDEENKVKSPECKQICEMGGNTTFASDAVAKATIAGIENYRFQINIGFDGFMLGNLTANMEPPTSVGQLLFQFCFSGLLRVVSAGYVKAHYGIVKKVRASEK